MPRPSAIVIAALALAFLPRPAAAGTDTAPTAAAPDAVSPVTETRAAKPTRLAKELPHWGGLVGAERSVPGTSLRPAGAVMLITGIALTTIGVAVKFGHANLYIYDQRIAVGDYYTEWNYVLMGAGGASMLGGVIMLSQSPCPCALEANAAPAVHATLVRAKF